MKKTFYAYHVVTERPMRLGQHILFDGAHHSGVYERVMAKRDIVDDIYKNPRKYQDEALEYPVVVALRELALEEVRREKYPDYPSRMGCLYVSETLRESQNWADYFISLGRPTFQIVKVKVTGSRFVGDAAKCFDGSPRRDENLLLAEKYWENGPNPPEEPPINEFLVSGDIEIVEIVKEFSQDEQGAQR